MPEQIKVTHNGSPQGKAFVSGFHELMRESREATAAWVTALRTQGFKAAHPDDDWVDRDSNSVRFVYPDFNDCATVGDKVALGSHDNWRVVRLNAEIPDGPIAAGLYPPRFEFRPEPAALAATKHSRWRFFRLRKPQ